MSETDSFDGSLNDEGLDLLTPSDRPNSSVLGGVISSSSSRTPASARNRCLIGNCHFTYDPSKPQDYINHLHLKTTVHGVGCCQEIHLIDVNSPKKKFHLCPFCALPFKRLASHKCRSSSSQLSSVDVNHVLEPTAPVNGSTSRPIGSPNQPAHRSSPNQRHRTQSRSSSASASASANVARDTDVESVSDSTEQPRKFFLRKNADCFHFPKPVFNAILPAFIRVLTELCVNLERNQHSEDSSQSIRAFLSLPSLYVPNKFRASAKAAKAFTVITKTPDVESVSSLVVDMVLDFQSSRVKKGSYAGMGIVNNMIPRYIEKKIESNVRVNQASVAMQCLESLSNKEEPVHISPSSPYFEKAKQLHPVATADNHIMPELPPEFTGQTIVAAELLRHCKKFKKLKSSGFSNWTTETIIQMFKASTESMALVTRLMNLLLKGKGGNTDLWLASRLVLIKKSSGGIRPIAIQDAWIRFLSSFLAGNVKEQAKVFFLPHQVGIGVAGGAEIMVHAVNAVVEYIKSPIGSDIIIIKIDFNNAFNSMHRSSIYNELLGSFPHLARWFHWTYSHKTPIYSSESEYLFDSEIGVKQGDPLGPFFFGCGAQATVRKLVSDFNNEIEIIGYLDDNTVIVKRTSAAAVYEKLVSKFKLIGLHVNTDKTSIFGSAESLNYIKNEGTSLSQIQSTSSEFLSVLGVPLGVDAVVKQEITKSIDDYVKVLPLLVKLSPKLVYYLLKFCINARPMYILRTSAPWLTKSAIEYFDRCIDNGIFALSSWSESNTTFQNIDSIDELNQLPDLTDVTRLVRSISLGGGGAGIRRGSDVSKAAYTASVMNSWQFISCQDGMTRFIRYLKSNPTLFIQKHVELIQPLELKYRNENVNNSATFFHYLADKSTSTPCQKLLTIKVEEKLISDLKALLTTEQRLPALATFVSNQPNETSVWLKHPFENQTLLQLNDKEFVSNFRIRILIEIFLRIENARHLCLCGKVIFPGLDEYHFLSCKAPSGPCSDRTLRHNEIRDELRLLMKKFFPEDRIRREEFIPDQIVNGRDRRKADVTHYGINDDANVYFDVSVTSPSCYRTIKSHKTHEKALAAALSREKSKLCLYGKTFGLPFKSRLIPIVLEVYGAFGKSTKQLLVNLNKIARDVDDPMEKQRLLNAIKWFKQRVVIICAKYTSSLIVFHGKNADALIPVDNREYEDEKIAEDPFNDDFVNEPDFIVEVDDDEIVEGA